MFKLFLEFLPKYDDKEKCFVRTNAVFLFIEWTSPCTQLSCASFQQNPVSTRYLGWHTLPYISKCGYWTKM